VTYYGSNYVGDKLLNAEIFKKTKNARGQASGMSKFVANTIGSRKWQPYPGATSDFRMNKWSLDQQAKVNAQFRIKPPQAITKDANGKERYFYGTPESTRILEEMEQVGNPAAMSKRDGDAAIKKLQGLQAQYEKIAKANLSDKPPMTKRQINVFNNCAYVVASDAAQTGINWPNSTEQIHWDTLPDPMADMQRITRCARLLPKAVKDKVRHIVDKIKAQEADIFQVKDRGELGGNVENFQINGKEGGAATRTMQQALIEVANWANEQAMTAGRAQRKQWEAISTSARVGASLGVNQAAEALQALAATKVPGGKANLVSMTKLQPPDPMKGTYSAMETLPPEEAIAEAMEGVLTEADRAAFAKAGYVKDSEVGTYDPVAVYMAMRTEEIFNHIEQVRPEVTRRLRASSAGQLINDVDVMNTIIDELSPQDRAILKNMKALTNVTRISVSADVPQLVDAKTADGGTTKVFAGYEMEHPVSVERNVRDRQRVRRNADEHMMSAISSQVAISVPAETTRIHSGVIGNMSRSDITKSLRFSLDDLVKGRL
jgi:hypothetical protein